MTSGNAGRRRTGRVFKVVLPGVFTVTEMAKEGVWSKDIDGDDGGTTGA